MALDISYSNGTYTVHTDYEVIEFTDDDLALVKRPTAFMVADSSGARYVRRRDGKYLSITATVQGFQVVIDPEDFGDQFTVLLEDDPS